MEYKIISTPVFQHELKVLSRKYKSIYKDIEEFEAELLNNPDVGSKLGGNIRKIRVSIKSKGKGKSGGARVITYDVLITKSFKKIYLLAIYDKGEKETISKTEIIALLKKCGLS